MWKHIFSYGNTRFWLRKDTGTMNRPLRLAECSPRISRCVSLHYWQAISSRRGPIYRTRVHEYPEIILRIYAVGITIRIISTYQNHLGWIEERAR